MPVATARRSSASTGRGWCCVTRPAGRFESADIAQYMRTSAAERLTKIKEQISFTRKAVEKGQAMLDRVIYKGNGTNLIAAILRDKIADAERQRVSLEESRDRWAEVVELLKDYGWQRDPDPQIDIEEILGAMGTRRAAGYRNYINPGI